LTKDRATKKCRVPFARNSPFRCFAQKVPDTYLSLIAKAIGQTLKKDKSVRIWIDADAAPTEVKQIVYRAAKRLEIETLLVANRLLDTPPGLTMVRSIQVREGADEADRFIHQHGTAGDLAITADVPLAGDLVAKGLYVIDPRGDEYSPNTIASRLSMRNFMDTLRGEGMVGGGSAPYGDADKKAFAATFDRLLTKAIRQAQQAPPEA